MEWEEHFPDGVAMVEGAKRRIAQEEKPMRYVNGRYKRCGEPESRWLYNIAFQVEGDELLLTEIEEERTVRLSLQQVEYIKLRPFYIALCIGFKAFVFYNDRITKE